MSDSILGSIGLSREDLLGGMPARRASTIVYAIENLTLALVTRSRHALARYQAAEPGRDSERQFMDAVSAGREQQERPAVQDLERYATEWSSMVPDVADTKAQICFQLSTRYRLVHERTPRLRAALATSTAWPSPTRTGASRGRRSALRSSPIAPRTGASDCAGRVRGSPSDWRRCRPFGWRSR